MQRLIIEPAHPHSLNDIIEAAKKHWGAYSKEKRARTIATALLARVQKLKPVLSPPMVRIIFFQPNKRTEKDNLCCNSKWILDSLVEAGVLLDDRWDNYTDLEFRFRIDKERPRIEVELIEPPHASQKEETS